MSDTSTKTVPTRETAWGRWSIIREVRVPTTFTRTPKNGKIETVSVAPAIVKAVLLDLAQWDSSGSEIYKGIANITHATGVPGSSVGKALRVLHEAGLLTRTSRGMHRTSVSALDWIKLETLRVPFRDTFRPEDADGDDLDDLDIRPAPPVDEPAPAATLAPASMPPSAQIEPSAELVAQIRALKHVGEKFTEKDAQWAAAELARQVGEDGVEWALSRIDEKTLAKTSSPDIRRKAAYLVTCAVDAFRVSVVDHVMSYASQIRAGEVNMHLAERSGAYRSAYRDALVASLAEEFEIGEMARDDEGWYLPISPRVAAVV